MIVAKQKDIISDREKQVLELTAYEYSTKEIAQKLYISIHTAISHRKNIMQKLQVKNTAGMIRMGFQMGLLSVEQEQYNN